MPDRIHVTKVPVAVTCARRGCEEPVTHLIVSQTCGGDEKDKWTNVMGICDGHVEEAFAMAKVDARGIFIRSKSSVLPS